MELDGKDNLWLFPKGQKEQNDSLLFLRGRELRETTWWTVCIMGWSNHFRVETNKCFTLTLMVYKLGYFSL